MKKPKGPSGKGVRVTNPLVPGRALKKPGQHHHRHRHHRPGKPHHHGGPGGHRMTNPLVPGGPAPVHLHSPHHHHKPPKKPVKRKLALGEGVACCAAEALAASLRLAGVPVGDEDVLALYWRTAADADAGATISATLEAAERYGLAGVRPASFMPSSFGEIEFRYPLLLGVTLPGGPHALTLDPSGAVWSWGGLYDLPGLGPGTIDEAWHLEWGI